MALVMFGVEPSDFCTCVKSSAALPDAAAGSMGVKWVMMVPFEDWCLTGLSAVMRLVAGLYVLPPGGQWRAGPDSWTGRAVSGSSFGCVATASGVAGAGFRRGGG